MDPFPEPVPTVSAAIPEAVPEAAPDPLSPENPAVPTTTDTAETAHSLPGTPRLLRVVDLNVGDRCGELYLRISQDSQTENFMLSLCHSLANYSIIQLFHHSSNPLHYSIPLIPERLECNKWLHFLLEESNG